MISRRLLRIKVLQLLYAGLKNENDSLAKSEKELFHSIQKAYELYHFIMAIPIELSDLAQKKIDIAKEKRLPTPEDLNPNTKFVENQVVNQLRANNDLQSFLNNNKLNWAMEFKFMQALFAQLLESEFYTEYMNNPERNYDDDKRLVNRIFSELVFESEDLQQILEEMSIYWNDDLEFVMSMIVKTIKRFKPHHGEEKSLMPLYSNDEDYEFVKTLFRKSHTNYKDNLKLIDDYTKNWDVDRLAQMDIIIMNIAITEIIEFPSIPVKVSLNEYIEISKFYSTQKSSNFVNGILDKAISKLKDENKIIKTGRGLIE